MLDAIRSADGLILGTPNSLRTCKGHLRLERSLSSDPHHRRRFAEPHDLKYKKAKLYSGASHETVWLVFICILYAFSFLPYTESSSLLFFSGWDSKPANRPIKPQDSI